MASILQPLAQSSGNQVERNGNDFVLTVGDVQLSLSYADRDWVLAESDEIAEMFGIPSAGCATRYEIYGDDPDMDLLTTFC